MVVVAAARAFPIDARTHAAVVFDGARGRLALYIDGACEAEINVRMTLSSVNDINNWLGCSQYR